ncbi:MAG: DNA mismatch repair protein MutS, partial [Bacillota bacterium]|nr:DNA mismatch repair protein MutS [Bacillota bacterium]
MAELTPMMQQYIQIKQEYNDCILFFRLGDFYEMFFEDAKTASRELEITLTGRDCGLDERAPMCGVPYHSAVGYIAKLINKGYKVAICEQVEDPSEAKGIVKRDVIRVVTPGTVIDQSMLEEKENNYVLSLFMDEEGFGMAYADISTGELRTTRILNKNGGFVRVLDELAKVSPKEVLVNGNIFMETIMVEEIESKLDLRVSEYRDRSFAGRSAEEKIKRHFRVSSVEGLGLGEKHHCICSVGALLDYLEDTQKVMLSHIDKVEIYSTEDYMILDSSTRRNLELVETMRTKEKKGSLLWLLDRTLTAMGGRMLKRWLEQPLVSPEEINDRLDGIEELKSNIALMESIKEYTGKVYDIERLMGRIVYGNANARDLLSLKQSVEVLPQIKYILRECSSKILEQIREKTDELRDIYEIVENAIHPDPPVGLKDGGIIKDGYDEEIDRLRSASREGKKWIASLERREKERTGIKSLKVGYNKVFGYYLEVTKANLEQVPEDYLRKQTLANAERYITPELKEMENTILGAQEKVIELEYQVFNTVKDKIAGEVERIKRTSYHIALLDTLYSLSRVAYDNGYIRPRVNEDDGIEIKDGRHPVVEKMLGKGRFVPNDTYLNCQGDRLCIITGPNMAGKSTYMRQVALIVLMAQIGSYVPASYCKLGVVDRIFTRVGASDDLASGQSTFMVEMSEVANILNNATRRSLLILDEIGRGT